MVERTLAEIDLAALAERRFTPSPTAWEDEVLYFLLLDRFSDGKETGYRDNHGDVVTAGQTPPFQPQDRANAATTVEDEREWEQAGGGWVGGNLRGLTAKIGYLKRLGVTAIWVSPVFKQVAFQPTYHGYGIQNYLDVDPHFGTREELREMVETAHKHGVYVVLDVIFNHTGNVFGYNPDRYWTADAAGNRFLDPRWDGRPYRVAGFNEEHGQPTIPFAPADLQANPAAWPNGAVWPAEFQQPWFYTQKGRITNWDYEPEYLQGDFFDLKDLDLGQGDLDHYGPSPALRALCAAYKYWIAYTDCDGLRIDTVKHLDLGATRFLTSVLHEFAQSIGKENFYLIGEITGGRAQAYNTLEVTGLDAALGIDDTPAKLEGLVKGWSSAGEYFDLFRNSTLIQKESHTWFRNKLVTTIDDHDQVRKGQHKARFCAGGDAARKLALAALAANATTLGIPCVYYGSEQSFDGQGDNDRFIREAVFGGEFGAFRTRGRHFFDEESPVYRELARIHEIRREHIALRRGRQYLREISGDGVHFGPPQVLGGQMRSVVPWSRIFDDREMLLAINTDADDPSTAWVTVDGTLHDANARLRCIYSTDPGQVGQELPVEFRNGRAVHLTVPPAGFVVFE